MKQRSRISFCLLPLLAAAVLATDTASSDPGDERAAIIDMMQAWERAVESGDYDALEGYYAEEAVYYPNGSSPLAGRGAIIDRNRQRGSDATVEITQHVDDVQIRDGWAIYSCLAEIRLQNTSGRDSARYVRVLLILQKGPDGQWRILRDIDNDTPDRPAARSITQLTDNLYRAQNDIHFTVFLVTPEGIILADPISTEFSQWLRGELNRRFGVPVKYVLYSHHHWDHASGGGVFADTARFIGQENMLAHLAAPLPEKLADVRVPDFTFRERTTVSLGGHRVEMAWTGPITHTDDMSVIRFPQEKVVFVVDFISIETMPYRTMGLELFPEWLAAIRAVEAMDFEIVAPGHGIVGDRSDVAAHRQYLLDLRDAVSSGIEAGASLEAMQQTIRLEEYSDWFMYDGWRGENIAGMYRILAGKN